ncbi:DUF3347 domain-containing protein [Mucilaginibacter sp. dw_454]|uniref:DUF3347 domain-containing protein n=1 Tax=Mucilaginibacter sp. dw_454 TaxID=2720079 RepID=UPI001BD2AE5B|nr:DUF3347 domain-containing protein [Mucilaginibacter sp. dw_454]
MKLLKLALALTLITLYLNPVKAQQRGLDFALNLVVKDYLDVKNALLAGNVSLAQNKAGKLVFDFNSVPDKDMTNQQHEAWFNYLSRLQSTSRAMGETTSIEEQRRQFSALSNAMYGLLKDSKLSPVTLYRQYSQSKDAYWLSNSQIIKNPYYGIAEKKMVKEGVIREVLPASK